VEAHHHGLSAATWAARRTTPSSAACCRRPGATMFDKKRYLVTHAAELRRWILFGRLNN
jgi:hypothetical protein